MSTCAKSATDKRIDYVGIRWEVDIKNSELF